MEANKVTKSHKPLSDGGMAKEEFIRVGTTLYKIVEQPRLSGGYVKKRIPWNNETLRQDYGKDYIGSIPKYDGFCTVPEHIGYRPVIGKFLNLYEPIDHQPQEGDFPSIRSLVEHSFGEQIRVGNGLSATALPATRSEVANPLIGIRGTQYGQEYIS